MKYHDNCDGISDFIIKADFYNTGLKTHPFAVSCRHPNPCTQHGACSSSAVSGVHGFGHGIGSSGDAPSSLELQPQGSGFGSGWTGCPTKSGYAWSYS